MRRFARVVAVLVLLLPISLRAQATALAIDSSAVQTFIDTFLNSLHGADSVPRGAIVVVQGDRATVLRGFGKTANGQVVNPNATIFRAASNSKLFATAAVLQLAVRGRLKLTDDVNLYLPPSARLAARFSKPIAIADLLTHTSGIENRLAGAVVPPEKRVTLAEFYARNVPYRAVAPGREISYSNIGMALAGYIAETVSGESFEAYAERHLFAPLAMSRSSFRQPPPESFTQQLAGGVRTGARNVVFLPYPAASLVTTPVDMAQFIIAQLNFGRVGTVQALDSEVVSLMQTSHWRADPDVPAVGYGFFEGVRNGHRYLFHTGDSGDHSLVLLIPHLRLGLYFVFSGSDEQTALRDRFAAHFLNAFVGIEAPMPPLPQVDVSQFVGRYRGAAYSRTNIEKMSILLGETVISDGGNGTLLARPPGTSAPIRFTRIEARAFRADSGETVAFQPNTDGSALRFTLNGLVWDPSSWHRVSWYEQARLHIFLLITFSLAIAFRMVIVPIALAIRRRRLRRAGATATARYGPTRFWWRASSLCGLLLLITPVVFLASAFLSFAHPSTAIPFAARNASIVLTLGIAVGVVICARLPFIWTDVNWNALERAAVTVLAAATVIALPTLWYVRLLYPLSV